MAEYSSASGTVRNLTCRCLHALAACLNSLSRSDFARSPLTEFLRHSVEQRVPRAGPLPSRATKPRYEAQKKSGGGADSNLMSTTESDGTRGEWRSRMHETLPADHGP